MSNISPQMSHISQSTVVSGEDARVFFETPKPRDTLSWGTTPPVITIEGYLDALVERKVEKILQEKTLFNQLREVKNSTAKKAILNFIIEQGKRGITQLSILDLSVALKLPAFQVEKIMESFSKRGLIREIV